MPPPVFYQDFCRVSGSKNPATEKELMSDQEKSKIYDHVTGPGTLEMPLTFIETTEKNSGSKNYATAQNPGKHRKILQGDHEMMGAESEGRQRMGHPRGEKGFESSKDKKTSSILPGENEKPPEKFQISSNNEGFPDLQFYF